MTVNTSAETALLLGVAQLLAAAGVGSWSGATAVPESATWPIFLTDLASAPDRAIGLAAYVAQALAPNVSDTIIGMQVRVRGDQAPVEVHDRRGAAYDALHGLRKVTLGTAPDALPVLQVWWQSGTPAGPDERGRWEIIDNYYVQLNRPGAIGEDG